MLPVLPDKPVAPRRRPRLVMGVAAAVAAVALLAAGWALAGVFTSPQQRESAAEPPAPTPITVEVVEGNLSDTVSISTQLSRQFVDDLVVEAADGLTVVTRQPVSPGQSVNAGAVVLEVSGRPVFLIPGAFPFYRDMTSGDSGPDVTQLQQGLVAAGYEIEVDGRFGAGTAAVLSQLYRDAGYTPPTGEPSSTGTPATASVLVVPASEFVVTSSVPALLVSTSAVGEQLPDGASLQLASGPLVAKALASDSLLGSIPEDATGVARVPSGDVGVTLTAVGRRDDETGESPIEFTPTSALDEALVGTTVVIVIEINRVAENALLVPSRAVVPNGAHHPVVSKALTDGTFTLVPVREIAQLSGRTAVEPITDGDLVAGDKVRVDQ